MVASGYISINGKALCFNWGIYFTSSRRHRGSFAKKM